MWHLIALKEGFNVKSGDSLRTRKAPEEGRFPACPRRAVFSALFFLPERARERFSGGRTEREEAWRRRS